MGDALALLQAALLQEGGLADRLTASAPGTHVGLAHYEDFPFGGYGADDDRPFRLALRLTPAADLATVAPAIAGVTLGHGGDGAEAHTEALYQTLTGVGGRFVHADGVLQIPAHGLECPAGHTGAACFRPFARRLVAHLSDNCAHQGPMATESCGPYEGISDS